MNYFHEESRCNYNFLLLILRGAWAYFTLNLQVYLMCLPHIYIVTLLFPSTTGFRLYFLHPLWSNAPQALSACKPIYIFIFILIFSLQNTLMYHPSSSPLIPPHPLPLSPLSIKVELYRCQQCKRRWEWVLKTVSLCLGFIVSLEGCRVTTCHRHTGRAIHFTQGHISQGYSVSLLYVCVCLCGKCFVTMHSCELMGVHVCT